MSKHLTNYIVLNLEEGKTLHVNSQWYMVYCYEWYIASQTRTTFLFLSYNTVLFLGVSFGELLCFSTNMDEEIDFGHGAGSL